MLPGVNSPHNPIFQAIENQLKSRAIARLFAFSNRLFWLQNHYGSSVRILPGDNGVSRMTPLKQGRVDLCACGIASYYGTGGGSSLRLDHDRLVNNLGPRLKEVAARIKQELAPKYGASR